MKQFFLYTLLCLLSAPLVKAQQTPARVPGSPYPATAVPDRLFLTSENYTASQRIALQTLMGVTARTKPEILRDMYGHRQLVEKAGITVDDRYYMDFSGLLTHFAGRLTGYILCNPKDRSTNVAISLAGIMNAVAIPADIEQMAVNAGLSRLLDVRGKDETWTLANYGDQFSRSIASYQQSSDDRIYFLGDYSAYTKAFQFWDDAPTGALANSVYGRMNKGATFFGWGPQEYETVEQLSRHSMMIHPSDWAPNMSTLTNIPARTPAFRQKDPIKPFEVVPNVHTVCFVISDGDNVQWLLGTHDNPANWNNPDRARLHVGWTISPALTELAPIIYEKYVDNCLTTPDGRNVLIAGPSGRGYYLPGRYPDADLDTANTLLNRYMKKADLRIVNIIDADDSDNNPDAYLKQDNIDALFYYSYGANYTGRNGKIDWYKDKPSIGGRFTLWGDLSSPATLAAKLNQMPTDIHSENGYSLIPVHIWSRSVNDILECIRQLGPNVRVVAPDEFVWLVRKNLRNLPAGTGNGLQASYYKGASFNHLKYQQTDRNIDFDWAQGSPDTSRLGTDQFSIRWTGKVQPLYSGQYTFHLRADDGVKLIVNGRTLINELHATGPTTRSAKITLQSGKQYDIEVKYIERTGNAYCQLEWESASQIRQVIPKAQLYSRPANTSGPVTAYQHCDFNGFHAGLTIGQYTLSALQQKGINDDEISSVKVNTGYKVILFEKDHFQGRSITLTANKSTLPGWDNKVSSLKVIANGDPDIAGSYTFKNAVNNLFMDVRGGVGGLGEGVPLQLWQGTGQANQTFNLKHLGDGVYTINAYHSAKTLDVAPPADAENAYIWQWTPRQASGQQFIAVRTDSSRYKFISVLSNKVLSVEGENQSPEARLVQRSDTGQRSACWTLTSLPPVGNGNGLNGAYYKGLQFDSLVFVRTDANIDFDWGNGAPGAGIPNDGYSIRWTGKIAPRYSGEYTFYLTSDNGRRLWINNQLVIDKWLNDWDIEYSGNISLTAGQQYDIKLEYFEDYGGANCRLRWSSAQQPKEIIPQQQLYSASTPAAQQKLLLAKGNTPLTTIGTGAIYPNPAAAHIKLRFKGQQANISICDVTGKEVLTAHNVRPDTPIDISRLKEGMYFVQMEIEGVKTTRPFIKQAGN
ncbi:RICIN domain-containing protein [Chitinophaga pendula]|uniref:PA14 domain-containing protein n=1 Tax=Chitinophaga TaxID=79328 RepID=UPI000BB00CD8|nr:MULTISPECIES: PA14 domain-containing protein [Chitinophaga]ASZ13315.1 hypothetical protein CK934_21300 [Chitinophaga sp. MD30]UCJ09060.1 RICIN domain-containing protein [Chitinophaga pendula]